MENAFPSVEGGGRTTERRPAAASGRRIKASGALDAVPAMAVWEVGQTPFLDLAPFLQAHGDVPLSRIERLGGQYLLTAAGVHCPAIGSELADATLAETVPGALLGSLQAAEWAWDAGLPDAAIPGILQAFRHALASGLSPRQALTRIQGTLRLALIVESYARHPAGLVHDRARVAHFTAETLAGRIGNRLIHDMGGDGPRQRQLIATYQALLERCQDDLVQAVREARGSGDYELAADLMDRFFQICVDVTAAEEWHDRLMAHRQSRPLAPD